MPKHMLAPVRGCLVAICAALLAHTSSAFAGPGHDHGPSETAVTGPTSPRVVATSETYELVGIQDGPSLTIYLDRLADTSPVTDASLEIIIDGDTLSPKLLPNGTFTVNTAALAKDGNHELIITVMEGGNTDLLVGTLAVPDTDSSHVTHSHPGHNPKNSAPADLWLPEFLTKPLLSIGLSSKAIERVHFDAIAVAGLALALGVLIGGFVRRRAGVYVSVFGLLAICTAGLALAGPGHDHGHGGTTALQGDAPRRLPDGEIFLPKPTQRLLAIRTRVLSPETARAADRLIGRVIPDPNRFGLVQSTIGGRVKPTKYGLPVLGQKVKAGDVLAYVEPAFAPIDASDVRQTAGDLEQRIAVLDARIGRQRKLVAKEIASRANLEDLEIERQGLVARRDQLRKSRSEPETLTAPVDGVIAEVGAAAGQVVASADTVFRIVDPQSLWVEAISFDLSTNVSGSGARAKTSEGVQFKLAFVGRSRALQQQATVLHYRVINPTNALNIGSPVKVLLDKGEPITGLIIPRSALAQAPNGQMVSFKRLAPERYLPSPVRVDDLDGHRVHVRAGLKPGDQIIVEGAPLVNQIR